MNNHHQPPDQLASECAAIAALLPLLDDDTLTAQETEHVREHLARCSTCQAQRRAYSQLNIALRRHFGPAAFAPLRLEEIMESLPTGDSSAERIEATPLPIAPQPLAPRRSRRIISGVASIAAVLIIALFAALIFTNRPRPTPATNQNHSNSQTITQTSLTGISMVSPDEGWMVGGTSTITYVTASGSSSISPPSPPASSSSASTPAVLIGVQSHTVVTEVSGKGDILLYHYKNGAWTQVHVSLHVNGIPHLTAISMDSPTDGWAVGGSFPQPTTSRPTTQPPAVQALLLHYDGVAWRQVNTNIPFGLGTVDMLSATDGWALTESNGNANQVPEILHYDGRAWTSQPLPASLASLSVNKQEAINFTGFSALPDGEAWAGAVLFPNGPVSSSSSSSGSSASSSTTPGQSSPGQIPQPSSVILHFVNGAWTLQATFANAIVNGLGMAGLGDGWATGQDLPSMENTNGQPPQHPQGPAALVLRYNGAQWTRVAAPLPGADSSTSVTLTQVVSVSPGDVWMLGMAEKTTTSMVVQGSQGSQSGTQFSTPQGSLVLLHYDGTRWTSIPQPALPANALPSLMDASFTSSTNGWAVGTLLTFPTTPGSGPNPMEPQFTPLVLHYTNGTWSRYTL